jgi:hypothetical protein
VAVTVPASPWINAVVAEHESLVLTNDSVYVI